MATDHGIDVAVLYETPAGFGLSIVESKLTPRIVGTAMQRSTAFFREIDDGKHTVRLRHLMSVLRHEVPSHQQSQVTQLLWQQRRTYIANPHYDKVHVIDWANPRPSLAKLVPGAQGVFVMPHAITSFTAIFEDIAEEMRAQAAAL